MKELMKKRSAENALNSKEHEILVGGEPESDYYANEGANYGRAQTHFNEELEDIGIKQA